MGQHSESARDPADPLRQRLREGERRLAVRSHRQAAARRIDDAHRLGHLGRGRADGRGLERVGRRRRDHDRRRCAVGVHAGDDRPRRRRRGEPEIRRDRAAAPEGGPVAPTGGVARRTAADRAAKVPGGALRRPSDRPGVPDRRHDPELQLGSDRRFLQGDVRRGARPPLRRRAVRPRDGRGGRAQGVRDGARERRSS